MIKRTILDIDFNLENKLKILYTIGVNTRLLFIRGGLKWNVQTGSKKCSLRQSEG